MSNGRWSPLTWFYFGTVVLLGVAAIVASAIESRTRPDASLQWMYLIIPLVFLRKTFIQLPTLHGRLCPTGVLTQFAAVYCGPAEGCLLAMIEASLLSWNQSSQQARRLIFNITAIPLSLYLATKAGGLLSLHGVPTGERWQLLHALVVSLSYWALNVGLVLGMMFLSAGAGAVAQARSALLWSWATYLVGGVTAGVLAMFGADFELFVAALAIGAVVLKLTHVTLKHYFDVLAEREKALKEKQVLLGEVRSTHLASLKTLATAIEAKDSQTHGHVVRVEAVAATLGADVGLKDEALEALRVAAMLHDVGKLAMPEYLLQPSRKLNPEDLQKLQDHARLGADILAFSRLHPDVLPAIRHHHERWDGEGFPDRLAGDQIPFAARIIAIANRYDALRFPRVGRGMSRVEAAEQLGREAGASLDPALVARAIADGAHLLAEGEAHSTGGDPLTAGTPVEILQAVASNSRESQLIHALGERLRAAVDPAEVAAILADAVADRVPSAWSLLFLPEEERGGKLEICVSRGAPPEDFGAFVERGWAERLARASEDGAGLGWAALRIPLQGLERGLLVMGLGEGQTLDADARRWLSLLVEQCAPALVKARSYQRYQRESVTDALTGLANGRLLRQRAPRLIQDGLASGRGGVVVLVDLNGFKGVNDTLGHGEGDRLLVEVGRLLQRHTRPGDLVVRNGGDEFVLILPELDLEGADRRLEAIHTESCALWPEGLAGARGTSHGIARFPEDARGLDPLLKIADDRMYQDKKARKAAQGIFSAER